MKLKRKLWIFPFIVVGLSTITIHSCKKNELADPEVPVVSTLEVSEITITTAKCGGNIENDGGEKVTERGICWNTDETPTIEDNKIINGMGIGNFTINLDQLTSNTTYYIRAYASNIVGTSYGKQVSFKTEPEPISIVINSVTPTNNSATSSVTITNDGGSDITVRGVCWNTIENPGIELSTKTTDGIGTGNFSSEITGLTANTTYFIRAYATNSIGTTYSNQSSFNTNSEAPIVETISVSEITKFSASCNANISSNGGSAITSRGACWSTTINPHIGLTTKTTDGAETGSFTSSLTDLKAGTTYYVRAYATNSLGTSYGNNFLFTTLAPDPPTVLSTLLDISGGISATLSSNVTDDGGAEVTAKGACWSISTNPHIGLTTKTNEGPGTGNFSSTATGLAANTKYYIRAYATNSAGTSYGEESNFTTKPGTPVIGANAVSSIGENAATCNVKITSDGGSDITERGVCWSTTIDPHTGLSTKTTNGTGKSNFLGFITGLTSNTTYYVRAYATNSIGTTYGDQIEIKTTQPITDNEGNSYKTVIIGTQKWMAENLKVTKYNNGDLIGTTATPAEDINGTSSPKYQWPPNKGESNVATYGRLYTYYVVTDSRGVCPSGWHIPTRDELSTMVYYLKNNGHNDNLYSGNQIGPAFASETNWAYYSGIGSIGQVTSTNRNSSGFNAKPAGYRLDNGIYTGITKANNIWSSSKYNSSNFYYFKLSYEYNFVEVKYAGITLYGFSARCLED